MLLFRPYLLRMAFLSNGRTKRISIAFIALKPPNCDMRGYAKR